MQQLHLPKDRARPPVVGSMRRSARCSSVQRDAHRQRISDDLIRTRPSPENQLAVDELRLLFSPETSSDRRLWQSVHRTPPRNRSPRRRLSQAELRRGRTTRTPRASWCLRRRAAGCEFPPAGSAPVLARAPTCDAGGTQRAAARSIKKPAHATGRQQDSRSWLWGWHDNPQKPPHAPLHACDPRARPEFLRWRRLRRGEVRQK